MLRTEREYTLVSLTSPCFYHLHRAMARLMVDRAAIAFLWGISFPHTSNNLTSAKVEVVGSPAGLLLKGQHGLICFPGPALGQSVEADFRGFGSCPCHLVRNACCIARGKVSRRFGTSYRRGSLRAIFISLHIPLSVRNLFLPSSPGMVSKLQRRVAAESRGFEAVSALIGSDCKNRHGRICFPGNIHAFGILRGDLRRASPPG